MLDLFKIATTAPSDRSECSFLDEEYRGILFIMLHSVMADKSNEEI